MGSEVMLNNENQNGVYVGQEIYVGGPFAENCERPPGTKSRC